MRVFLVLLVVGFGAWWHFHTPAAAPAPAIAVTTPSAVRPVAVATTAPAAAAPATGASWPRRQIDRAQAAVDATKKQRDELQ